MSRKVAYDCRYFLGDRPCRFHKTEGAVCECDHYEPVSGEILIIKLDAAGDVLRTTCLLPLIAEEWPGRRISWITSQASVPLLENNPFVDEVVAYGPDAIVHISSRSFERVISLDASWVSASLAAMARAEKKVGFVMHEKGHVTATNPEAEEWLRMGVFDDLKRENQRTYQQIMCSILGLPEAGLRYVMELTADEREDGRRHLQDLGVNPKRTVIGIHTGGGGRWRFKQWHEESFAALIPQLTAGSGGQAQIVLFGGPLEREQNRRILKAVNGPVFNAGCDNSLRHFAALVRCCSVVLSGDSLAMHVALAMGRRVVVLFGPTSHAEIEVFGRGEKVIPEMDCLVCYKRDCDFVPNCMDLISVERVKQAVMRQVALFGRKGAKV